MLQFPLQGNTNYGCSRDISYFIKSPYQSSEFPCLTSCTSIFSTKCSQRRCIIILKVREILVPPTECFVDMWRIWIHFFVSGDCSSISRNLHLPDGVYRTILRVTLQPVDVLCKSDSYTWTVIHQRLTGNTLFNRSWAEYKRGFGSVSLTTDFW